MPLTTGQITTGEFYFQLNTGKGFTELEKSGEFIAQPLRSDYYSPVTGYYPFGLTKTTTDPDGAGPINITSFGAGGDCISIEIGACNPVIGGYYGPFDTRKNLIYTSRGNVIVNKTDDQIITSNSADSSILGGYCNTICNQSNKSSIVGGIRHRVNNGQCSFIGGGNFNEITSSNYGAVVGGLYNCISASNQSAIVNGGYNFISTSAYGFIGGGNANDMHNSTFGVIVGGNNNCIQAGVSDFIGGGDNNVICSQYGHYHNIIVGGYNNCNYGEVNTIIGGTRNQLGYGYEVVGSNLQHYSLIGNGDLNYLLGASSTIVNATEGFVVGHNNFLGGGYRNSIDTTGVNLYTTPELFESLLDQDKIPLGNFIGNGYYNCILHRTKSSVIVGGRQNTIVNSSCSAVLGGFNNSISGAPSSFIIGNRGHIQDLVSSGNLSGVGIISDGYTPAFNFESNKLLISFKKGIILDPGIKISSHPLLPRDGLESVEGDLRYTGFTGVIYPRTYDQFLKPINIGVQNDIHDYTDYSGLATGLNGVRTPGVFVRGYNPSTIVGHANSGGHANILIGINNVHHFEHYEAARIGFLKYSGVYGTGFVSDGFVTGFKTINNGPWTYSTNTWPTYQGANILVGNFNTVTGNKNMVFGMHNSVSGVSNGSLVLGDSNSIYLRDTVTFIDSDGAVTGTSYGTGLWPHTRQVISIGFRNTNLEGTDSIDFGHGNMSRTNYSQVIGRRNWATGDFLVVLGSELSSRGYRSSNIGYGNIVMGDSGAYNNIFGYNNIIDVYYNNNPLDPNRGNVYNNQLIGNLNYVRGQNSLLVGQRNTVDTLSGFSGDYTNHSITVGAFNNALGSYNGLFGLYNRSTGLSNYIFGLNNNTQGFETTTLGIVNNNYGQRSVILGNTNAAYGINNSILGSFGYAVNSNQITLGGGESLTSWPGSSQKNYLFWKGITSGTTRSELMLDGVNSVNNDYISGKAFIHSGMIWNGKLNIIAAETGLGNILTQERYVTVANKNGSIHIISNQLTSSSTSGTANWGITLSGDNTNKAVCINATGEANKFIYWNIVGEFNQTFTPTNETLYRKDYSSNTINNNLLKSGYDLWNSIDPNMTIWQTSSKFFFR